MTEDQAEVKKSRVIITLLIIYDIMFSNIAYGLALWLRFDFHLSEIPVEYIRGWIVFAPVFAILVVAVFAYFRLYSSIWRYVSYVEMLNVVISCLILGVLHAFGTALLTCVMPVSYYIMGFVVMLILLLGVRVAYRSIRVILRVANRGSDLERLIIVGAGEAGRTLLREIRLQHPLKSKVLFFIDDAPGKLKKSIDGVQVKGTTDDVPEIVRKYNIDRIILAIPSAGIAKRREIFDKVAEIGCEINTVPILSEIVDCNVELSQIKKPRIEDYLGRDEIKIDNTLIGETLKDKVVLVTGGGGSIGSEIIRQVAAYEPKSIIIYDVYENGAYLIQMEIRRRYPDLDLKVIIGSICNEEMISAVMSEYCPYMVFHAAAHKHVPLMETVPWEAVMNNVLGTYYTAKAAAVSGCEKFVLISTDKAVNPTNIMGATKRMCEMVVKALDEQYDTDYAAVRFGNVLESNGSVIPLFRKQIEEGGPVTVTHPEITRFFMTIPEAVSLVLQAGAFARGGELFVLDMGEPVKIENLARNMIRMSGYIPDVDIKVEYIGLRPGEKLYEELMMETEGLEKTENSLIYIGEQTEIKEGLIGEILELRNLSYNDSQKIVGKVKELVETYRPEQ